MVGIVRILMIGVVVMTTTTVSAQTHERGTMSITEGLEYMVAFPQVWASPIEEPMLKPMVLFISSRFDTKVRITTPSDINQNARINLTYSIKKDQVQTVLVDLPYMNEDAQTKAGSGIFVTGDRPISVTTYQAWQGNGEMTRHLPIAAWGRDYYSMNFYQDRYGSPTQGYKYRPGQILIIAARDSTVVSITPTYDTEGGKDLPSIPARSTDSVVLNRGETFLVKGEIDEQFTKDFISDLSGTFIQASKPIGVVSGHTKVAIMRYPDVLPPTGVFAVEAHFVRSNPHEAMLPVEFAGTEFVTIPCMYTPTRVVGQDSEEFGIDDDKGDVIRFIAIQDNTTIQAMRQDGSGLKTIMRLNAGETWLEKSVELATLWVSDKPILIGHYGKSYAKIKPPSMDHKEGERPEWHPTVESGMPMLMSVPSVNKWITYGVFKAPEGMDNFFNIVFKPEEVDKIKIDGRALNQAFGGSMRLLQGTPYAYIRTNIGMGDHTIESTSEDVKWMAWNYGSLDGLAQGRAYGSPVGVSMNTDCVDTIDVADTMVCGNVEALVTLRSGDDDCSSIFGLYAESLTNYQLVVDDDIESGVRTASFRLLVQDPTKDAVGTVLIQSSSGEYTRHTYTYTADKVSWSPESLNFGKIQIGTMVCDTITFKNEQTDAPMTVTNLWTHRYPNLFTIRPSSFVLPPGGSIDVVVCVTVPTLGQKIDTVVIGLECFEMPSVELIVDGDEPVIYASDIDWGMIPWDSPGITMTGELMNSSDVALIIYDYDSTLLQGNFVPIDGFDLPIVLQARQKHEYRVMYQPSRVPGAPHRVEFPWYSNAVKVDSISIWNGDFISGVDDDQFSSALSLYPSPLILSKHDVLRVEGLEDAARVVIVDEVGRIVGSLDLTPHEAAIPSSLFPSAGLYTVVFDVKGAFVSRLITCLK